MSLIYRGITIENRKHEVVLPISKLEECEAEILTWCVENFGYHEDNGLWNLFVWLPNRTARFTFLRETDAMAFRLMWT